MNCPNCKQHDIASEAMYKMRCFDCGHLWNSPKMRLAIFAQHITEIMRPDNVEKFTLSPFKGFIVKVEIQGEEVYLNGMACGNRHGGVQEFTRLVNEQKPEIIFE